MLRTDYVEDIFEGNRKYRMTTNADNSVSFEDVTNYTQYGDYYGAALINAQNEAINNSGIVVSTGEIPPSQRLDGAVYFFH